MQETGAVSDDQMISLEEKWGDMGLVVSKKALSSIWRWDGEDFVFDMKVSVEKV